MATFSKKWAKREGKVKYDIQAKTTDSETKKVKYYYTTWHNPDNLPDGKKAYQAAVAFGVEWEQKVKNSGEAKTRFVSIPTFAECADEHFELNKGAYSDSHRIRTEKAIAVFKKEWGGIKVSELTARDIKSFFANMTNTPYMSVTAKLKDDGRDILNKAVLEYGVRKAASEGDFARPTLFQARAGNNIQWKSAELICKKFGLKVDNIFEKVIVSKQYKKETIKGYQRVLSPIFEYSISNDWMTRNFALSKRLGNALGGLEADEVELLDKAEQNRLLDILSKQEIRNSIAIYLALFTGMRKAEICGLEWKDIDFNAKLISVRRNRLYVPGKGIIVKPPKTKSSKRQIPIFDALHERLSEYKAYYDWLREDDHEFNEAEIIFCDYKGNPQNPDYLNTLLKRYLNEAGCHILSAHKLRHGWITDLISRGVPVNVVSKLAGHSNIATTLAIYTHYCKDADNSVETLNKIFSKRKAI